MRPAVQEVYLDDTLISNLAGVSHESDIPRIGRLRRRRGRGDGAGPARRERHGQSDRPLAAGHPREIGREGRQGDGGGGGDRTRRAGPSAPPRRPGVRVRPGRRVRARPRRRPVTTYKAGDTFYEPTGCVHRVTRNPSARARTRLLAVILHPRDAEKLTVPEEAAKKD